MVENHWKMERIININERDNADAEATFNHNEGKESQYKQY
jgi:hypothetical protein